jgi:acyl carrier protein
MGLDAVELILAVEDAFCIAIPDAVIAEMITPAALISFVQSAVKSRPDRSTCISMRAFHRVRACLMKSTGVGRSEVTLSTPIRRLFSGSNRVDQWKEFKTDASLVSLPDFGLGSGWLFPPRSVNDLVSITISQISNELKENQNWTHDEVRQIVRRIISDQLGVERFEDTDEFVRDLGLD